MEKSAGVSERIMPTSPPTKAPAVPIEMGYQPWFLELIAGPTCQSPHQLGGLGPELSHLVLVDAGSGERELMVWEMTCCLVLARSLSR